MLKKISELKTLAERKNPKRLVLAAAQDANALKAALHAHDLGIIKLILVGNKKKIQAIASENGFLNNVNELQIINDRNNCKSADIAVKMVNNEEADILMKGHITTSDLLKAVLNKEWGLRTKKILSHLAIFELPCYHKILGLTDAAVNIAPNLQEKFSLINNSVDYFHLLGITHPKIALLSAISATNPKIKSSVEAKKLSEMASQKQINNCIIDGPIAFDNAINNNSAEIKQINSPVAGDADILVCDNIDVANSLYKSFVFFAQAKCAATIIGASAPIVLNSRADSNNTKFNSIVLAAAIS